MFLTIDQSSQSSKAALFDADGQLHARHGCAIKTTTFPNGGVEHDGEDIVRSIVDACQAVIDEFQPERIEAAAMATQRSSIVCWDRRTGKTLSPVLSWRDVRAKDLLQSINPSPSRIRHLTGLRPSAHYGASKLAWCLRELPQVAEAANRGYLACGPLSSFLSYRITGERLPVADPCNASRTLLMDIRSAQWSEELLDLFGLKADHLPRIVANRHRYGDLEIAGHQIPLRVVTGDQSAVPFCFGLDHPHYSINFGSGAFVQAPIDGIESVARDLLCSVVWKDQRRTRLVAEGTVNGAALAINQWSKELNIELPRQSARLEHWISREHPLIYLNGDGGGLGSPWWISGFASRFVGRGSRVQALAAVLESIAFLLQANLERLPRPKDSTLLATGGLAASNALCQAVADLSGATILRPSVYADATAAGLAALLTGAEPKMAQSDSIHPCHNPALHRRYEQWLGLMPQTT